MSSGVFITCAVTGVGATTERSELVPVTPPQIAEAALGAARARAAIVHIHVRDPRLAAAHAELPVPEGAGRSIGLQRQA